MHIFIYYQAKMSTSDGSAPADESVLDDILTPMERSVKTYLNSSVAKDLVELLALMSVERPDDPHHWLGLKILERSPMGPYIAIRKEEAMASKRRPKSVTTSLPVAEGTPSAPLTGSAPPRAPGLDSKTG